MQCEICGKSSGTGTRIELDGVEMIACGQCTRFGKPIVEKKEQQAQKSASFEKQTGFELLAFVDDFGARIKSAREKKQLSFEDFSRLIKEKASVLRNIETGHLTPTNDLAKRLEKTLSIKIIEKSE